MQNKSILCIHIILLLVIFLNININHVFADNLAWPAAEKAPITSPYGPRSDIGAGRFHYGVDIGYDEGMPVIASADGIIDFYGEASGFTYAAVIYHPSLNISTLYGHIRLIATIHAGQQVKKGDVIGIVGAKEAASTGSHLHFEIHTKRQPFFGGHEDGAIDPLPYLNGAQVIPGVGGLFENSTNLDWSVIADIAKPIKEISDKLVGVTVKAVSVLTPYVLYLFLTFATICLVATSVNMMMSEQGINGIMTSLLAKAIFYSMFVFLIINWSSVLNIIKDYFTQMGAIATAQTVEEAGNVLSDPTAVIQKGASLTVPFFNYIGSFDSYFTMMVSFSNIILVFIFGIVILALFLGIGIQILLAYIEFYVVCAFSMFDLAWASFKEARNLKFVGNGINAVFAVSMKLLWYIFFSIVFTMQLSSASFVDMSDMQTIGNRGAINLETAGPEGIMVFMAAVKLQESRGDYYVYSYDGYGYGAYQINFDNWNAWCEEASLAADYDWQPHANMQPAWSPERQDAVARFKMMQYYQQFGSWRAVAEAWNGGPGSVGNGNPYADKVFAKAGQALPMPTFDFVKALKLFVFALIFFILGNKVSKDIVTLFGSPGFRYYL